MNLEKQFLLKVLRLHRLSGRNEVKIELGDIGTETLKVTYQTEVTNFEVDDFKNEASLDGEGVGEEAPKMMLQSIHQETPILRISKELTIAKNDGLEHCCRSTKRSHY